uniref:Sensory neuron membrane protein 2 n=1 Tax=Anoplophora glabripennis TaxID=217634 RepID=V5I8K2_ANOGL
MVRKTFCSIKVLLITTLALLVVLVGVLVLSFVGVPKIIDSQVKSSVQLEKGTEQWDRFVELPFPLHFKVWLFNVTNPEEIQKSAKPILNEVGPYYYDETVIKDIMLYNPSDDTVTYKRKLSFAFNKEESGTLTEDDELVLLNPVMLSMTQLTTVLERMALGGCLDRIFPDRYNNLFIKVKVGMMLFEGYEFAVKHDDLGVACGIIRNKVIQKTANIRNIEKVYKDGELYSLRFSFFHYKESPDGVYSVSRGVDDISMLGHIRRWNEAIQLPFWGRSISFNNDTCNTVRGTDSTIYPPSITENSELDIFNTDICRVIKITYAGQDTYKGVDGFIFTINENTLRNETEFAENDCFCVQQTLNELGESSCYLDGLIDLKSCVGAPILLSFPHFLYADDHYREAVEGVDEPDESIHKLYLLVEPNTGTPLEGKKRAQLNAVLRPANFLSFSEDLPQVVIPMFWVDEGVSLPQKYVDELNDMYFNRLQIAAGVKYGVIAVTLAAVVTSTGFLVRKKFFTG